MEQTKKGWFSCLLTYAGAGKRRLTGSVILSVVSVTAGLLPYYCVFRLIEAFSAGALREEGILTWCGLALGAYLVKILCFGFSTMLSHYAAYHILEGLRLRVADRFLHAPLGEVAAHSIGEIKNLMVDKIEDIEPPLAHMIPEGMGHLALPIVSLIALTCIDGRLALASLATVPLSLVCMALTFQISGKNFDQYFRSNTAMNSTIVEYINGMEVVKVFNRDGDSYKRFETDVKNYRDFTLDWYWVCWPWMALYNSIIPCTAMFTLPLGAWFVLRGWSTLPDLVLVLCMSFGIGAPLLRSLSFLSTMPQVNFKIEALEQLMSAPPLKQTERPFTGKDHSISFEDVRFGYKEEEVLHGISLSAREGSLVALVGESGSGKSTLAKLLVHFYDVSGGAVKIGGQDVRDMSIESLNDQISYVSQEQFLFNMSLLENIRLGKLDATDEEVLSAAEKAQCGEFLARLPQGIHTMAGDGGKQLSGGERQRISLARAILKNAPIVVLDEATAFMDPENEEKMNAAIAQVIRGKTVIVIAHRLHSIVNADQICVLHQGNVAAVGTHKELLERSPEYQTLWQAAEGAADWKVSVEEVLA